MESPETPKTKNTSPASAERLDRLSKRQTTAVHNAGYTKFVRMMRMILPLTAIGIIAMLFLWNEIENEQIAPTPLPQTEEQQITKDKIAKNELLNPQLESLDKKNQPYKITADRAIQGEKNKDLIMLENPVGILTMSDGANIKVQSKTGAYRQDTERFFLEGDVYLSHDSGYSLKSSETHIDLKDSYAWTDKSVFGKGPDIEIDAHGLQANGKTGQILFTGPVKLVLEGKMKELK